MTTFEPVGYRAPNTGVLTTNLQAHRDYGVRNSKGRRMNDAEWEAYVSEHFEVVYRMVE